EIHNDSHLLQQPSDNGIQDQEVQADPTPMVEVEDDNMQPVAAVQADQIIPDDSLLNSPVSDHSMPEIPIIPEDSLLNPHNEPSSVMSANPMITENQAAMLPTSEIQKINTDCKKEITEAIAEIRLKYRNKRQEVDATFNSQNKEVESNMNKVVINQALAAAFRQKCQDVSLGYRVLQQGALF
nr:hypothetical protein [Tanacetum cinerariifolium]